MWSDRKIENNDFVKKRGVRSIASFFLVSETSLPDRHVGYLYTTDHDGSPNSYIVS